MTGFLNNRLTPAETPLVILSEGCFGQHTSKTAIGVIRYGAWPVSCVIDSTQEGKTVQDVMPGLNSQARIVDSLRDALKCTPKPKALLLGTAPIGGELPEEWRDIIQDAIKKGLHIINGLHILLNEDVELGIMADKKGVILWDVRATDDESVIARQLPRPVSTRVITTVGTDCSVGKMSTSLEIDRLLKRQGAASEFVATGQTGIMIAGDGVPLDRVIGDFMAGRLERVIDQTIRKRMPQWVIVEGQGSLIHPAYSGVTLSLLHGSAPDGMILCHNPALKTLNQYDKMQLPSLAEYIRIYETAAAWIKPAKVLAISLNTVSFPEEEARALIGRYQQETGLPVTDPVRFGANTLVEAIQRAFP